MRDEINTDLPFKNGSGPHFPCHCSSWLSLRLQDRIGLKVMHRVEVLAITETHVRAMWKREGVSDWGLGHLGYDSHLTVN